MLRPLRNCNYSVLVVLFLILLTIPFVEAETEMASATQHMTVDFEPLPDGVAYTVDLERASVSPERHATFFMALKAVHAQLHQSSTVRDADDRIKGHEEGLEGHGKDERMLLRHGNHGKQTHPTGLPLSSTTLGLIEEADEPLQQQVLSQKRLATYFGTVQLGQCVDKTKTKTIACVGEQKERLTFKMLFDTGSCEFWVPGVGCTKDPKYQDRCQNHRTFDPEQSDSYKYRFGNSGPFQDDQKMCIQYLSGKIEGFMVRQSSKCSKCNNMLLYTMLSCHTLTFPRLYSPFDLLLSPLFFVRS